MRRQLAERRRPPSMSRQLAGRLSPSPPLLPPSSTFLPLSAAMERWASPGAEKKLVFFCEGEEEVETFRHLVSFINSVGKELPEGQSESWTRSSPPALP